MIDRASVGVRTGMLTARLRWAATWIPVTGLMAGDTTAATRDGPRLAPICRVMSTTATPWIVCRDYVDRHVATAHQTYLSCCVDDPGQDDLPEDMTVEPSDPSMDFDEAPIDTDPDAAPPPSGEPEEQAAAAGDALEACA